MIRSSDEVSDPGAVMAGAGMPRRGGAPLFISRAHPPRVRRR